MSNQVKANHSNQSQTRFTHQYKKELAQRVKRLYINKELTEFITGTIAKLSVKDKLAGLHYFRKLAVQVLRAPDPDHYEAFKDKYDGELSEVQTEQRHYQPVKWIDAEITYITNTIERLSADDVNQRLDEMQSAKKRLSKAWLTKEEVMDLFGIGKSTLNRRVAEGMPAHKNGKTVYFYLEEINGWMRQERD